MKTWKKFLSLGLASLLTMSTVACGSTSGKSNKSSKDSGGKTEVTFWNSFTGADGDMLVSLVDKYNKENKDGVKVKMDISTDLDSQLSSAFAAGTGPTLLLSSSTYRFTYGKYLQDISDIFDKTGLDKSDFISSYLDYCSDGDKLYFVPFQLVGYYMYWNKDLFKEAGLDPEKGPATWDEWKQDAEKITNKSKNIYGSGISYGYNYQIAHIMQRFGGLAVTKDSNKWKANFAENEGYKKFLKMYSDMVKNGDNPQEKETDPMMTAGQIGMTVGGPWVTAGLDKAGVNYGIGQIPTGDAGEMNSCEVLGFSVTKNASDKQKEAAYKFIKWWNTADKNGDSPALQWSLKNGYPAYMTSVMNNAQYQENKKLQAMTPANADAPTDFICDSSFEGINGILSDVIPPMINSVAFDQSSIDDALKTAQNSADDIVAKYNK